MHDISDIDRNINHIGHAGNFDSAMATTLAVAVLKPGHNLVRLNHNCDLVQRINNGVDKTLMSVWVVAATTALTISRSQLRRQHRS